MFLAIVKYSMQVRKRCVLTLSVGNSPQGSMVFYSNLKRINSTLKIWIRRCTMSLRSISAFRSITKLWRRWSRETKNMYKLQRNIHFSSLCTGRYIVSMSHPLDSSYEKTKEEKNRYERTKSIFIVQGFTSW